MVLCIGLPFPALLLLRQAQEFVLHSPTLTSTKWWPGGMGKTASHAVVMARLFVAGRDHGPHAFIVQLRDLATHLPMPGIVVGDIGSKFGFGSVDNGFMRMDHVRIPRQHMLMRFAKVGACGARVVRVQAPAAAATSGHLRRQPRPLKAGERCPHCTVLATAH